MKYYIKTFGCQQNKADSQRIASSFESRGMKQAHGYTDADYIVINTCMVRESAENRVYGVINNLGKNKGKRKIIVTGCMVGLAHRDKTGKYLQRIRDLMPHVDEFMPIEEVGFDNQPVRQDRINAWVPISNGCNNFCSFCVVPFTRGREISRPYQDIINECLHLKLKRYKNITLLGQNVNSYGADLVLGEKNIQVMRDLPKTYFKSEDTHGVNAVGVPSEVSLRETDSGFRRCASQERRDHEGQNLLHNKPIYVKHLGRYRIPTLFPVLLEEVARIGFEKVDFISSNPWDFSDELINVISRNSNITRTIHLPIQSGDDEILKQMNRWYTSKEYLNLVTKLKSEIKNLRLTTDIIVGFCGETDKQFDNTVNLCKEVGFEKVYVAMYSQRPMTAATKIMQDNVPHRVKKLRWQILEDLINKPHINHFKKEKYINHVDYISP